MCRIPEPYEIADAYYDRLDEARERLLHSVTCSDCYNYVAAPDKWVKEPCGYCTDCEEFVLGDEVPGEIDCESWEGDESKAEYRDPMEGYYDDWDE